MLRAPQATLAAKKARKAKAPKEPRFGSAAWELQQKNSRVAENGRARRNDAEALHAAGQLAAAYGSWRGRKDGVISAMNAVAKRLRWEERSGWTGRNCGVAVPASMTFEALASEFGINRKAIQRFCDKALARNDWAPDR